MNTENMEYDTNDFDFFSLVDVVNDVDTNGNAIPNSDALAKHRPTTAANVGPDGGIVDGIDDLDPKHLFDTDEEAELQQKEIDEDPNTNLSDLKDVDSEAEAITTFNDLPDDALINFGGRQLNKAEVSKFLADYDDVKAEREIIAESAKNIETVNEFIIQNYKKHKTTIDLNIERIQRQMSANISATEYGELSRQLNQAQEARSQLNQRVDEEMRALNVQKAEIIDFRIRQEQNTLNKEIPNWGSIRGQVLKDAYDNGVNLAELENVWSPELAKALYKASMYDRQKQKRAEKALAAAKAKAPRSTSSVANQSRTNAPDPKAAQLSKLKNKMNNGGLDERDTSNMFKYLVD
ncbi:hypothetical protein VAA96_004544 [Salmonella enterica]|nr:hypothetical protein [Salmonella enterica]